MLISDIGLLNSAPLFSDEIEVKGDSKPAISDALFNALIKSALRSAETTPLNRKVTNLLGISTDDEAISTKQIGVTADDGLHGILVSTKPNRDDIILVRKSSTMMEIYLSDSRHKLRAAATLDRDCAQPTLVSIEDAAAGYARELGVWVIVGEMARA